jgi:hypothetical protein
MTRTLIAMPMALALALGAWHGPAQAEERFERVKVFLERNVTDKDAEVKFEATGGTAGLASLKVTGPDGRTVIDFKTPDSRLGIRHLSLESPEPKNDGRVQADFPAGTYTFSGSSAGGERLEGKAMLSHVFPETTAFLTPRPDATNVSHKGLRLSWQSVKGLDAHVIVIEQESSGREMRVNLPANATTFNVPDGFLLPDTEYKLAIGTVAKDGNASFIETGFTTAKK